MPAWLPVIFVWFVSLFATTLVVINCIYRSLHHGLYRWKNVHKHLSPWILLALLTAAFMAGNVWFLVKSSESDINRVRKHARLFIGLFVGSFFLVCAVTAILWSKYQNLSVKNRDDAETKLNELPRKSKPSISQNSNSNASSLQNQKPLQNSTSGEFAPSCNLNRRDLNDAILVLRNLDNPDEEFCLNLSNSDAPVVTRKSAALSEEFLPSKAVLPKYRMVNIQDGVRVDFEC